MPLQLLHHICTTSVGQVWSAKVSKGHAERVVELALRPYTQVPALVVSALIRLSSVVHFLPRPQTKSHSALDELMPRTSGLMARDPGPSRQQLRLKTWDATKYSLPAEPILAATA